MQESKKVVILGHFGVGKTSLIRRFVSNSFSDNYKVTIGVHITKKVVNISVGNSISLILWVLEGTDDIETIRTSYLLGTHGVVFVFDVTRPSTFQGLVGDLEKVGAKVPKVPTIVVGNKTDLVDLTDLNAVLKENGISPNFLSSAKTGDSVEALFQKMATLLQDHA